MYWQSSGYAAAAAAPTTATPPLRSSPKYYCLDVECCATGPGHNDRAVCQIGLVDEFERVVTNILVLPGDDVEVKSYLTALTGITEAMVKRDGVPLAKAQAMVRELLPKDAVLVGQNIAADIRWTGLKEKTEDGRWSVGL